MTFLKLGFRSLFRQKRRTLITLTVITFGIGCLLLTVGHSTYIDWGLRESTIHSETGHLQVYHADYFDNEEETILQFGLEDAEAFRQDLLKVKDVSLVMARIDLMGLIANGDKSVAKEWVEVFAGGRVAILDDFRKLTLIRDGRRKVRRARWRQDKGHKAEWAAFVKAIVEGGEPPIPYEQLTGVARATFAALEALRSGKRLTIL